MLTTVEKGAIDTGWFIDHQARLELSRKQLAELVGTHTSELSRMVNGIRPIHAYAPKFAKVFGVSVEEVLRHAGVDVDVPVADRVTVAGWVDDNGWVHRKGLKGSRTVRRPDPAGAAPSEALRFSTGDARDGWIAYVDHVQRPGECLKRYCVVTTAAKVEKVRFIRARAAGTQVFATCAAADGPKEFEEIEEIISARPVLWIKCS